MIRDIVIVGGGSAGWLTAAVVAAAHRADTPGGLRVTVVESPTVGAIGVGEGTWPTMRDTLRGIGVSEADFLRECDASFKQGSEFRGWVTGAADDRYFHPFMLPHGYTQADLVSGWLQRHPQHAFAPLVSVQPHLCMRSRAPKQPATPEYAAVANYAYHLDAGRFGEFLRRHCVERLGVTHVSDHVVSVTSAENGDIAAIELAQRGSLSGDLFVDCTGMQSLLLGRHCGVGFIDQQHVLFNDCALAVQVPHADARAEIASHTVSTAQRNGWVWDIGLPTRRGIGHVYSSAHTDDAAAEAELRAYVAASGGPDDMPAPRKLTFRPGYRERFWHRNCVAIGLSAGFIEPLEASAIALVELSAAMLSEQMPATREDMDRVAHRFNDSFRYRWERVIDFLKLHYVLSRRNDTAFWRDHRADGSIPDRLHELLALWRYRSPSRYDFVRVDEVFPSASYQYILYGMGFRPDAAARPARPAELDVADARFREAADLTRRMLAGLPGHRDLITHITQHGLPKI
ncbi:tryptophan halogenase family protein [Cognatilysobacter bugurensis]|uniref:tryptophan halogenase family protein n=1 Tax=Cognatilysobacter bugurensis TaxID=543356 RepID=UPI001E459D78|nr:tryptophan halogenase family protein [Lysobacter bugurensis]